MNLEIGTEAAQFPEKEYINGIFIAVYNIEYCIILSITYSEALFALCQPQTGLAALRCFPVLVLKSL